MFVLLYICLMRVKSERGISPARSNTISALEALSVFSVFYSGLRNFPIKRYLFA